MEIQGKKMIKIATAGSVDDGKSTLIGPLACTIRNSLTTDKIEAIERSSKQVATITWIFPLQTEALLARARGKASTIDVAQYLIFQSHQRPNSIVARYSGHVGIHPKHGDLSFYFTGCHYLH